MVAQPISEMWTEFDRDVGRPDTSVLLWFVGRDARGSPIMHTDSERVVDLVAVTTDQKEAYRALNAVKGDVFGRAAA